MKMTQNNYIEEISIGRGIPGDPNPKLSQYFPGIEDNASIFSAPSLKKGNFLLRTIRGKSTP
jgi:hypothetical protein